jgi:hypothetical protein
MARRPIRPTRPPRTGVCLVRIERQRRGVLVTLRTNDDIEQLSTERARVVADVAEAVRAVRDFLEAFVAGTHLD